MRIKKKYILEAISKLTTKDVEAAKGVVGAASELEKIAEPVFGKEKAKDIVGNLLAPDNKLEEVGADKVHTAKFDSCVADLEKKGTVDNPYAVCQASLGKKAIKKSHQRQDTYENIKDIEVGADEYEKEQKAREELGIKPVNKTKIVKGDLPFDAPKPKKRIKEVIKIKDIKK